MAITSFCTFGPLLGVLVIIPFIVNNAGAGHRIDVLISIVVILFLVSCVSACCLYAQLRPLQRKVGSENTRSVYAEKQAARGPDAL